MILRRISLLANTCEKPEYVAPVAKNLTYNGNSQELLTAGSTNDGIIYYSIDDSTWGVAVPSGINAGSYTVHWKLIANEGYCDIRSKINVTIAKADTTYTAPTAKSLTYNGSAQALLNAGAVTGGTIQYSDDNTTWETNMPTGTNANTYASYWRIVGDSNHNDKVSASISTTISPKTVSSPTITLSQDSYVYNNTAYQPTPTVKDGSTTIESSEYTVTYSDNINAGTATCTITDKSGGNYTVSGSKTFTIAKVTPTVVAPTAKVLTYNGSAQELVNAGSTDYGTLQYKVSSDSWSTNIPNRTRGGSYTVQYRVVGDSNINDVAAQSVQCSINEKQVTATVTLSQTAYTYNGSACEPSVTVSDSGVIIDPSEYTVTYSNNINAGTGTVTISDNVGGDYEVIGSNTFTINKANPTYTAPTATSPTYNGTAQYLLNAGSTSHGTIQYSSDNSTWSTTIPTGTNANTYTSYWRLIGDSNHNNVSSTSISTTIAKVTPTVVAPTAKVLTYNGSAQELVNAGSTDYGTLKYSTDGSSYSTSIPSGTNATSYTVYYKVDGDSNINSVTAKTVNASIAKADATYTAPTDNNLTYNGSAQALLNAGAVTGGTIYYSSDNSTWSTTIPTGTNANTYTSYWKITGDSNHNDKSSASISTTISPKTVSSPTITLSPSSYIYNASACQPTPTVKDGSITISSSEYTVNYSDNINAGTATCTITDKSGGNYTVSGSKTFTINKANSSLSFAVTDITVEVGEVSSNVVTVNAGDGTVTYSSNNTSAVTVDNNGSITGVSVGNATITANISSTSNYNSASTSYTSSCVEVIIAKFNVTSTTSPTRIASATTSFTAIEIDGVKQSSVTTGYTFDTVGEHTVKYTLKNTSIGSSAFTSCISLTSIEIPDSVTSIGNSAFRNCSGLTSIDIPDSVTSIGNEAFYNCRSLTSCTIGSSVTSIGNNAFRYCRSLTSIVIPDNVTSIGTGAFYSCSGLTSCNIGSGVTSIGQSAFAICSSLTSIDIPSGVTSIGSYTFSDCSGLTSVTIPDSVTSISNNTFEYCRSLTSIDIPDSVTSIGNSAFQGCSSLTSIDIPSGVTYIGNEAFYNCRSLRSCTIGTSVTTIGTYAFSNCSGLTSIVIPDSVTSIGNSAFASCSGLTSCTIGSGVTSIGGSAFSNCSGLTSIVIPDNVTGIGNSAFAYCSGLTSIIIPDSVTSIGNDAFYQCKGLTSCTIGSGVTSIGTYVFIGCTSLTSVTVDSNNAVYDSRNNCNGIINTSTNTLIAGCKNTVIPNSVTSIGNSAFTYCTSLTSIVIPDNVTSIGTGAFNFCSGLRSCTIGSDVTSIGGYAFYQCTNLTSIVSYATTAPTIQSSTFQIIKTRGTLTVPIGSSGYDVWMGTGNYYLGKYGWTKVEQ